MAESDIQKSCVDWFTLKYQNRGLGLIVSIPNEGRRNARTGGRLKKMGLKAGFPDLQIIKEKDILFVEMKTLHRNSQTSDKQDAVHVVLRQLKHKIVICRSIEEFIAVVDKFMK
ncbi:VRR-NUC domain-containing protein [Sphingobacterium bovisgrunnientis]|uniref:VRR-NUC domain-containing protein n=1 Tax=Sphingobacterium bovisgrunnientis TaxID=1874697 RepID=UPI00135C5B81|nr:VRR-NUC domain-containing protein [Sphingobacterium bovisgrunnientis]